MPSKRCDDIFAISSSSENRGDKDLTQNRGLLALCRTIDLAQASSSGARGHTAVRVRDHDHVVIFDFENGEKHTRTNVLCVVFDSDVCTGANGRKQRRQNTVALTQKEVLEVAVVRRRQCGTGHENKDWLRGGSHAWDLCLVEAGQLLTRALQ